ncbi:MAG: LysR family substrate-binding domain-containing protein [Cypionkella sp.]
MRRLIRLNPHIVLTLVEDGQEALLARVRSGELHVALTAADPVSQPREQGDLQSVTLWRERLAVALPEAEMTDAIEWADLAGRLLLCRPQDDWRRFVAHVERLGGPTLQFMEQDVSEEGLLALVGVGLGWSIVPASLPVPAHANVRLVPLVEAGAELDIQAVWRRAATNPALSRFRDLCRQVYSDVPSQSRDPSP